MKNKKSQEEISKIFQMSRQTFISQIFELFPVSVSFSDRMRAGALSILYNTLFGCLWRFYFEYDGMRASALSILYNTLSGCLWRFYFAYEIVLPSFHLYLQYSFVHDYCRVQSPMPSCTMPYLAVKSQDRLFRYIIKMALSFCRYTKFIFFQIFKARVKMNFNSTKNNSTG